MVFIFFSAGQSRSLESPNLLSVRQQPQVVDQKITKELEVLRLAGPFDAPPCPVFRVSPLGIVPKKTAGDFRMIHRLSYPKGESVNNGISQEHSNVRYANIDKAIKRIKHSHVGFHLAKTDIKSEFRFLAVNPFLSLRFLRHSHGTRKDIWPFYNFDIYRRRTRHYPL